MSEKSGYAGRSILDIIREELDVVIERLMMDGDPEDIGTIGPSDHDLEEYLESFQIWAETRGQAQALAYAVAVLENPYEPDVPRVRREAMARYQKAQKTSR